MNKILLLEDNKSDVDLVCRELKIKWPNVSIVAVSRIAEAQNVLEKEPFDIALFDLKLPDGNGLDLLIKLREENSTIPIIILTSSGNEDIALTALKAGANNYIPKTQGYHKIIPNELIYTLNKIVKNQKQIKVLYAEHQKSDVELTLIYFKKFAPNITFKVVPTGEDVLNIISNNYENLKFDLLLLDYLMPGINGLELTKVIRNELNLDIPIIIVTGQGDEITAVEALKLGANDYVVKHNQYLLRLPSVLMNAFFTVELERNNKSLIRSESRYRLLATNTLDAIFTTDLDLNITYINNAILNLSGYTPKEIIGLNAPNLTNEDGLAIIKEKVSLLLSEKSKDELKQVRFEIPLIRKDNTIIFIEIVGNVLLDNTGLMIGFQARAIDISERKRAENVQHVLLNISNATQSASDIQSTLKVIQKELGTLMYTRNFIVTKLNNTTNEIDLLYYDDEKDFITEFPKGKTLTSLVIETGKSLLVNNEYALQLERENEIEKVGFDSKVWLGVPLKTKGKVTGAFVMQSYENENAYTERDKEILEIISHQISITIEQKQTEENLLNALEKAKESDRLKSAFLANMSHEIRTPMSGILGFSELLKQPGLSPDKQEKYLSIIDKSGVRMLNTINDLMDISKIEAGQVNIYISEVNVYNMLNELYDFFKDEAINKGLQFKLDTINSEKDFIIKTDSEKIYAILTNLIKNAIKFTLSGNIAIGYIIKNEVVEFYVNDTGIGIQKDRQASVFDRFVQADIEDKAVFEGSGLGLAISKSYSEMLQGSLSFTSEQGVGTKFIVKIPTKINETIVSAIKIERQKNQLVANKNLNILIVEDDEISSIYLAEIVSTIAHKTHIAKNGVEAVKLFSENKDIDLVLMDISLPQMDGYEATKKIKAIKHKVVIIAQTAFALSGDKEKALKAGCDNYITKPINHSELLELISNYFNK